MSYALRLLTLLLLLAAVGPAAARAQAADWRERPTAYFTIIYAAGAEGEAERYAGFADQLYDEISGAFGHRPATPIALRLYPDLERYYEANPRARGVSGIVAHADYRRNEVVVIVAETAAQSEDEVRNNVRHELTHIVASELSENRLNPGFQEGLAQYMELATPERARKLELLREAFTQGRLLPWSAFDQRDQIYQRPEVSYPQALSVVMFLVERSSFAKMRDLLTNSASSSGYRTALQRTFDDPADALERAWLAWLPRFLLSSAEAAPGASYDLGRAEQLLAAGDYASAAQELDAAAAGLRAAGQADRAERAEQLAERARAGLGADALARQAYDALTALDYAAARQLAGDARQAYAAIGDTRQQVVLDVYLRRAERGIEAERSLSDARALAEALRYPQARQLADLAAAEYGALGDRQRAADALTLRQFLDQRQALAGGLLLLLGAGGIAVSVARRMLAPEVEPW